MRISIKISAGGGRSLTRLPFPAREFNDCLCANDKLDVAKARAALHVGDDVYRPFRHDADDDECVYAVVMALVENLYTAYNRVVGDADVDCDGEAQCRDDKILDRKIRRGKNVFAAVDVKRRANDVRVRPHVDNPFGIVGAAEVEVRSFVVVCTQIVLRMRDGWPWISIDADADLLKDAEDANRRADERAEKAALAAKRAACTRRVNGYCSPVKCDCPLYKNGRCTYAEAFSKSPPTAE